MFDCFDGSFSCFNGVSLCFKGKLLFFVLFKGFSGVQGRVSLFV